MKYLSIVLFSVVILGCKNESTEKALTADEIIYKSIELAGGNKFEKSIIEFDFRDRHYYAKRKSGDFSLMRITVEVDKDSIFDILNNDGFKRIGNNGEDIFLEDLKKYSASVNSVHYFSTLPYGLNGEAVNKTLLGEEEINNKTYYKIKVTFNKEGGGEDYEDIFVYWVDKEFFKTQYLAYSYNEDDGVGMRFREAYNERYINGLRFVDYNNYKAEDLETKLTDLGKAFENNQLKLLSKIELENVNVDLIDL